MKNNLPRLIAAPFTPMHEDGTINLNLIESYASHLEKSKISGAFICGTTGEGLSLTIDERMAVTQKWVECAGNQLQIITHVGGNCTVESAELAAHSEKTGASAIAAFAPSFYKPDNARDLVSFLAPIAAAAPELPFYYYHIPSMNGVYIPMIDLISELTERIENFAGIKYTHMDLYDMQLCISYIGEKYEIMHGHDETLLCGLTLGLHSAVGSTYNYIAPTYFKMAEAFHNCDLQEAREYQQDSVKLVQILNRYGGGVRAGKAIMQLIGLNCGPCRLPIQPFSEEELSKMKAELDEIDFFSLTDFFKSKREVHRGQ
jgi:N-acetylneuraminate lyase